ncbi:hypothetical protein Tco_0968169 [Tanacetum coccineum]
MCDVPLCENTTPLNALNEHSEIVVNSNDDNSSSDDDLPTVRYRSTSTFLNLFLEETNTFDNSIPESETFRFNLEEISSGSPTTHSELSLPDYKAFCVDNNHFKEKSSNSTTTHVDFSQYDSFIFDLSNDHFPHADRSDLNHEEFADELTHIMIPELECFNLIRWSPIREGRFDLFIDLGIRMNGCIQLNVNVPLEDDPIFSLRLCCYGLSCFSPYPVVPSISSLHRE